MTSPATSAVRVLLAAGGTGGHVYPAIALGRELLARNPETEIRYMCGDRPGELAIYRSAGIAPVALPISGRRRGLANTAKFAAAIARSTLAAAAEGRRFRPAVVAGFGNYLSLPAWAAARAAGARLAIHEQNAHPGAGNRWLARRADLVLTAAAAPPGVFPEGKTRLVGNPVRAELLRPVDRAAARTELGLPAEGPLLLCFGGSLGAAGVNRMLREALPAFLAGAAGAGWSVLWAPGRDAEPGIRAWIAERTGRPLPIRTTPYLDRMDQAYAAADLVLARAGALTLAELTALGKPSILVPLPTSAGDHQRANARALEAAGAALVAEETAPDAGTELAKTLASLAGSPDRRKALGRAALELGRPRAAEEMAEAILELAGRG